MSIAVASAAAGARAVLAHAVGPAPSRIRLIGPAQGAAPRGGSSPLPHALRHLEGLALRRDRRRDDDLRLLHLTQRPRAAHPHRRAERLDQILGAVVDPGRTEQNIAEGAGGADLNAGPSRQRGVSTPRPPPPPQTTRRRRPRAAGAPPRRNRSSRP